MKAVLMSIRPQWAEKIFNGSKSIEVRKSHPSIPTPFKAYVYCTKTGMGLYGDGNHYITDITNFLKGDAAEGFEKTSGLHKWNGKVIGSFVCDDVITDFRGEHSDDFAKYALLSLDEQKKYGGNKLLYGWHITEPLLFDKPRELGEFSKFGYKYSGGCCVNYKCPNCIDNGWIQPPECKIDGCFLTRPPQSWCYIETGEYSKRGGKE